MSKPIDIWISGINFDEYHLYDNEVITGFITLLHPKKKEAVHFREVVPIDWEKIKTEYWKWDGRMYGDEKALEIIQQLVESQLNGEN